MRRPIFLIGLAMLAMLAGVGVVVAQTELPDVKALRQTSYICAADVPENQCVAENAMTRLQSEDSGNRTNVPLEEVPEIVVQAVIAMEDRDFFHHDGVNPMGIARALYQNVKGGSVSQGGSTITQQYVKNAFDLTHERSVTRKVKEAVLSLKLEQQMSKEEILEGYLNTIFFGRGAYGIAAASQAYFGIDVRNITDPGQAALLAGVIRAPALAEPSKHPEEAARRRHTALVAMQEEGYLTAEQVAAAEAQPVEVPWVREFSGVKLTETLRGGGTSPEDPYIGTDYLPAYIERELQRIDPDRFTDERIRSGGLRIYTSLDYGMQAAAWEAVTSTLPNEDDPATPEWEGDPEAALVAVDDQGLIRAMVGSRHPFSAEGNQNNFALSRREPGSTYKPLVLAEAIKEGYSLKSRYNAEARMEFEEWPDNEGNPWKVTNYDETNNQGVIDLIEATAQSSNTAYAQLMLDLGTGSVDADGDGAARAAEGANKVAELAHQMGLGGADGPPEEQRVPASVLGSLEASPLEMAGVYSTFANQGVYRRPDIITRVEQVDQDGNRTVLYQRQVTERRVLSETQANLVTHALTHVIDGGTGEGANIGKPAAGKTGTSQRNRNAWFAGYVPRLTAVVWMGHPNADYVNPETGKEELWPMNSDGLPVQGRSATGGSFPATIWKKFMEVATADMNDEFVEPTPEQIEAGEVLNEGELFTSDETTTTVDGRPGGPGGGPGWTIPDMTLPDGPGRPGRPGNTTTSSSETTTTTIDDTTPSTDITIDPGFPPDPTGGG